MEVIGYIILWSIIIYLPPYLAKKYSHNPKVIIIPIAFALGLIYSIYEYFNIPNNMLFSGLSELFCIIRILLFIIEIIVTTYYIRKGRSKNKHQKGEVKSNDK